MHERGVHGVKAGFVVDAGEAPAEADDAEVRRQEQLEVVAVLDVALRCQCEVERAVDRGAERIEAEVPDRGPDLERAGHPAELQAEVREVHLALGDHRVLQIVGGHLERAAQSRAIAHQHGTALEWLVQPFVRIERHGVGALDAGQGRTPAFGERGETAVRGVNVHPHPVLGADVGDRRERVDAAAVGRPGGGRYEDGAAPERDICLDRADERVGAHGVIVVDGDHA